MHSQIWTLQHAVKLCHFFLQLFEAVPADRDLTSLLA
jgi:hypothetical protein